MLKLFSGSDELYVRHNDICNFVGNAVEVCAVIMVGCLCVVLFCCRCLLLWFSVFGLLLIPVIRCPKLFPFFPTMCLTVVVVVVVFLVLFLFGVWFL